MKILVVSQYYRPDITAAAFRIAETVDILAAIGHELTVITSEPHRAQAPAAPRGDRATRESRPMPRSAKPAEAATASRVALVAATASASVPDSPTSAPPPARRSPSTASPLIRSPAAACGRTCATFSPLFSARARRTTAASVSGYQPGRCLGQLATTVCRPGRHRDSPVERCAAGPRYPRCVAGHRGCRRATLRRRPRLPSAGAWNGGSTGARMRSPVSPRRWRSICGRGRRRPARTTAGARRRRRSKCLQRRRLCTDSTGYPSGGDPNPECTVRGKPGSPSGVDAVTRGVGCT